MCRSSRCSCQEPPGGIWRRAAKPRSAATYRGGGTVTPWWPDLGIGTADPWPLPWNGYDLAQDGLPRSRGHHPDAPCCHRGDDGCAGDGWQRVIATRHGPPCAPSDGGGPRVVGPPARRTPVGGDLHRGRYRERQPCGQGHLLGATRFVTAAAKDNYHSYRAPCRS